MSLWGLTAAAGAPRKPPRLDPDSILRTVIYVQAAFRRFLIEELRVVAGIRPTMPAPSLAVSLWCCRRLLRPELIDVESEGMAVAVMICAREKGLTLGPIVAAYERYAPSLPLDHPVLELLTERFAEVEQDAEEDLMSRLRAAELPSQARAVYAEAKAYWGAPERPPGGGEPLFPKFQALMESLRCQAEESLTRMLPHCRTRAGLQAMDEAVELEFQEWPTTLRARLRSAKVSYREYLGQMGQNAFGWPPVGPLGPLCSSGRWLATELGEDHIIVEDFVAAVKRLRRQAEQDAAAELRTHSDALTEVRTKLNTDPSPPRLLLEGYQTEIEELLAMAMPVLERRRQEVGTESHEVIQLAKGILLPEPFAAKLVEECEQVALVLRRPDPPANPGLSNEEGEERLAAAVQLTQLLGYLKVELPKLAAAYATEFCAKLERARPTVGLFTEQPGAVVDEEGWWQPPGFDTFERPLGESTPPPTPWRPPAEPTPTPPEVQPDVTVNMRLHGVTMEEAQQNSEILLLEKLAMIVAKECGIPREWITHIALAPPKPKEEPKVDQAPAEGDAEWDAEADAGGVGIAVG